jgi:hypothetical protein
MPAIRVLMITSTWPQPGRPCTTHFIERQANFLRAAGVSLDVYHFRGRRRPWRYLRAWRCLRSRSASPLSSPSAAATSWAS